jgi:hypothetical protein
VQSLGGPSSPEAAFAAFRDAGRSKNWRKLYDTVTPESQDQLVGLMALTIQMAALGDEDAKSLAGRHGLSSGSAINPAGPGGFANVMRQMQEQAQNAGNSISNKREFFADAMSLLLRKAEEKGGGSSSSPFDDVGNAELTDVVITEDRARGKHKVEKNGRELEMPIAFRKVDGSWRVDLGSFGRPGSFGTPSMMGP